MRLLFVCTGNICRSLTAERLALKLAEERGLSVEARSCGIAADHYFKVPAEVWAALEPDGVRLSPHRPQLVGRELLGWADRVLVMTRRHKAAIADAFPEHLRKTALLREAAGLSGDVPDPMGGPLEAYRESRRLIREALEVLLDPARAG